MQHNPFRQYNQILDEGNFFTDMLGITAAGFMKDPQRAKKTKEEILRNRETRIAAQKAEKQAKLDARKTGPTPQFVTPFSKKTRTQTRIPVTKKAFVKRMPTPKKSDQENLSLGDRFMKFHTGTPDNNPTFRKGYVAPMPKKQTVLHFENDPIRDFFSGTKGKTKYLKIGEATKVPQDKDIEARKGTQPSKYYKGLSTSTKLARDTHFKKGATKSPKDSSAYKPAPGDASSKTSPSRYTIKYRKMYGESFLFESKSDKSINAKSEKTGIPASILKAVYRRGVAAWRTGHRPGTTPEQWGHARVNSFITGGKTRTTADKDLWAKVKKK